MLLLLSSSVYLFDQFCLCNLHNFSVRKEKLVGDNAHTAQFCKMCSGGDGSDHEMMTGMECSSEIDTTSLMNSNLSICTFRVFIVNITTHCSSQEVFFPGIIPGILHLRFL
mmetsp:Transcript_23468/g.34808  ORF Transcript_23468/g.34808 Transcript_23468/m.34808 type:complete len:111 (-) Transcript_23468:101-433(-)